MVGEARANDEVNYFFSQGDEPVPKNAWSNRRPKKILDEQTLLSLSAKKNLSSLAKLSQELDPNATLQDRLNVILKVAGNNTASMASLPSATSTGAIAAAGAATATGATTTASRSQYDWENAVGSAALANTYTDTRLQALRYLTEDMIRELDETVQTLADSNDELVQLALPAQVICDWHADWTDLTERADYSHFPMWHTKSGKEGGVAGGGGGGANSSLTGGSSSHGLTKAGGKTKTTTHEHKKTSSSGKTKGKMRRDSSFDSPDGVHLPHDIKNPKASKVMSERSTRRRSSKVSSVIESVVGGGGASGRRQSTHRVPSILGSALNHHTHHQQQRSTSFKNLSPTVSTSFRAASNMGAGVGLGLGGGNKPELTNSRVITSQNSNGFSLNYQLSSKLFREKGWTVLKIDREETDHFNEKSILSHLSNSIQSINDCRRYNELFGLVKPCKIRFYGDHRREQIEKYKSIHIKPKKSAFAMSILRNEIPRPLDLQYMLDIMSNPNLVMVITTTTTTTSNELSASQQQQSSYLPTTTTLISSKLITHTTTSNQNATILHANNNNNNNNRSSLSVSRPGSSVSTVSTLFTIPKPPPLLSTHTNDGTTCVYYPSGQLAIVAANVFGFFVDSGSSSSSSTHIPSSFHAAHSMFSAGADGTSSSKLNLNNFQSGSFSVSGGSSTGGGSTQLCLKCQPVKDAYTVVVYDRPSANVKTVRTKEPMPGLTSKHVHKKHQQQQSTQTVRTETKKSTTKPVMTNTTTTTTREKQQLQQQRMLCAVSSLGYCVVYRNNGMARFICTEFGGCLCNRFGSVYYQWKWDELKLKDYEKFKDHLITNLNENIRLEYRNPSNIRLKFECDKESIEFDLSCNKQNSSRIHEMLNRTVSDFPMQSKLGQLKIATNAKTTTLHAYRQHHASQQQHAAQSIRKTSQILDQSFQASKDFTSTSRVGIVAGGIDENGGGLLGESTSNNKLESILEHIVSYRDVPIMKELLTTQKKIRGLLDDWLNYCRTSLNIMAPSMYILPELKLRGVIRASKIEKSSPLDRKKSRSAELMRRSTLDFSSTIGMRNDNAPLIIDNSLLLAPHTHSNSRRNNYNNNNKDTILKLPVLLSASNNLKQRIRSKSALIGTKRDNSKMNNAEKLKIYKSLMMSARSGFGAGAGAGGGGDSGAGPTGMWKSAPNQQLQAALSHRTFYSNDDSFTIGGGGLFANANVSPRRPYLSNEDLNLMCPVSLHEKLAKSKYDVPECRCRKLHPPLLRDLEFDYFIRLLPSEQLAVVLVVDSQEQPSRIQEMIHDMFVIVNRGRIQPCKESLRDECRYFSYDLRFCTEHSDHTLPLLLARHNIAPGMVLIYKCGQLLFCDHIFNGYGYSEQDFVKQLNQCRLDAQKGKFLPYNFKFDRPVGKHGRRTAWGGQIGGVGPCVIDETSGSFAEVENIRPLRDALNQNRSQSQASTYQNSSSNNNTNSINLPNIIFTSDNDDSPIGALLPKISSKSSLEI